MQVPSVGLEYKPRGGVNCSFALFFKFLFEVVLVISIQLRIQPNYQIHLAYKASTNKRRQMRDNQAHHKYKKFIVVQYPLDTYIHYLSNIQNFHLDCFKMGSQPTQRFSRAYLQTLGFEWVHLQPSGFFMLTTKHTVFSDSLETKRF